MTLIAAIARDGIVYMAADGATCTGSLIEQSSEPKLYRSGELLMGGSGTVRALQVVRHKFLVPTLLSDLPGYFATVFVDALLPIIEKDDQLDLLIGVRGQIFHIHRGGSVTRDSGCQYSAIGEASPVALGALYALPGHDPMDALRIAMEAGHRHCSSIRGPFTYLQTPPSAPSPPPAMAASPSCETL